MQSSSNAPQPGGPHKGGRRMTGSAFKAMDVLYTLLLAEKLDKGRGPGRGGHGIGLERRAGGFLI